MSDQEVSLGEVHRLLIRVDRELNAHRAESRGAFVRIDAHLGELNSKTATNAAAVASHHARLDGIDRDIRDIKRAPAAAGMAPLTDDLLSELKEGLGLVQDFKGAVRTWRRLFRIFGLVAAMFAIWQLAKRAGVAP